MAFDVKKLVPLAQMGNGRQLWSYHSTDGIVTDADAYFTQSQSGWPFKVGDMILMCDTDAVAFQVLGVASIDGATGAVTVGLPDMSALS